MPYTNKEKQKEYQRKWIAKRRAEYLADKKCLECGTVNNLEIDHMQPNTKVSHRIWSWNETRRNIELAKCQILCYKCHKAKTKENGDYLITYDFNIVLSIREEYNSGNVTQKYLSEKYGISFQTIHDIVRNKTRINL